MFLFNLLMGAVNPLKWFFSPIGRYVGIAAAVVGVAILLVLYGKKSEASRREVKQLKDHIKTRERMDAEKPLTNADLARERLRNWISP